MNAPNYSDEGVGGPLRLYEVVLHVTEYRRAQVFVEARSPQEALEQGHYADMGETDLMDADIEAVSACQVRDVLEEEGLEDE